VPGRVSHLPPQPAPAPRGSERRAYDAKFPLSGAFFSILLVFTQRSWLSLAVLLLGISKAQFLTSPCFLPPPPRAAVLAGAFWGVLGEPPRCSPALAGLAGTPCAAGLQPPGEAEGAASASLPRGQAGGGRGWCCRKVALQKQLSLGKR